MPTTSKSTRRRSARRLTPRLLAQIEEAAEAGSKDSQIYQFAKIPQQTWSAWSDPENERHQPLLVVAMARARARMARTILRRLCAMPADWQAGAWLLCQHYPASFARLGQDVRVTRQELASS